MHCNDRLHQQLTKSGLLRGRHIDHSGGIPAVVRAVGPARADAGRPRMVLDVHPDRPRQRGVRRPAVGPGVMRFAEVRRRGGCRVGVGW